MSLFRRGGLTKSVFASLDASVGGGAKVLAWAPTADGHAVGLADRLAISDAGDWRFVEWHEIETGGWNREAAALRWVKTDGSEGGVTLVDPGGLPELFMERVEATIVVRLPYESLGGRQVTITARRGLGADQQIVWGWSAPDRSRLSAAVVSDVEAEVARVRAEYEAA